MQQHITIDVNQDECWLVLSEDPPDGASIELLDVRARRPADPACQLVDRPIIGGHVVETAVHFKLAGMV